MINLLLICYPIIEKRKHFRFNFTYITYMLSNVFDFAFAMNEYANKNKLT